MDTGSNTDVRLLSCENREGRGLEASSGGGGSCSAARVFWPDFRRRSMFIVVGFCSTIGVYLLLGLVDCGRPGIVHCACSIPAVRCFFVLGVHALCVLFDMRAKLLF